MRNPIHKRLENVESWQHLTFMACLCERMAPNFALFCQMTEQEQAEKTYHNILNLVWEFLTVKGAKINFENQLEKLEEIIPDVNNYDFFGVVPALDACEALGDYCMPLSLARRSKSDSNQPNFVRYGLFFVRDTRKIVIFLRAN